MGKYFRSFASSSTCSRKASRPFREKHSKRACTRDGGDRGYRAKAYAKTLSLWYPFCFLHTKSDIKLETGSRWRKALKPFDNISQYLSQRAPKVSRAIGASYRHGNGIDSNCRQYQMSREDTAK